VAIPPRHNRHRIHASSMRRKAPPFVVRNRKVASAPAAAVAAGPITVLLTAVGLFFAVCGVVVIAGFAVVGGAYAYFTSDLPHFDPNNLPQFETTRIYDRYGNLIDEVSDPQGGNRFEVSLNEISPYLINATVAAEDKTFWTNKGIDIQAIGRAVRNTFVDSSYGSSGASTITMQVIKQAFPDRYTDPSKEDKVRQVFLAYGVAQKYSKEEVLTFYLNQIPYGNRSYGIQAAAHNYFNVDAKDLKLWQASILAGLPQAPSAYDPTVNLDAARSRQLYVLSQMVDQGYITEAQKNDAYAQSADPTQYLKFRADQPTGAPHFVNYVRQYVEQNYGPDALYRGGLKIYTTIDMDIQSLAEDVVRNGIAKESKAYDVSNGALVAIVPWSGQILCMVGSTDFNDKANNGEFNVAVNPRQPGSSIKPIAYGLAFEKGWYPSYVILDYHKTWDDGTEKGYTPNNFNLLHNGAVTVRDALQQSLNIPALHAMEYDFTKDGSKYGQHDGLQNFVDFAHAMGLTESFNRPVADYGLGISLALGGGEVSPLQLTNAYATFANLGKYVEATPIVRIEKSDGTIFKDPKTGKDVDNSKTVPQGQQVMDPGNAYLMTSVLTDNKARTPIFGASSPLILRDRPVAAKTGTTNDFRDGWTVGYTTQVAVGVWVGNNDNHPMREGVDGVENAGPIWNEFMRLITAHEKAPQLLVGPDGNLPAKEFYRPASVVDGESCAATGHKPVQYGSNVKDLFVKGKEPTLACGELTPREQSELLQAYADLTHNASLLPTTNPDGSPAKKKTEFGHYTGAGASKLNAYLSAVDAKYRPSGVRAYNPNPRPIAPPEATLPSGTAPPGRPRVTQAPAPVGQPTAVPGQPVTQPTQSPKQQQNPPLNKPATPVLVPPRKP
jgi:membrane peptidoglycan carboxypeptidase